MAAIVSPATSAQNTMIVSHGTTSCFSLCSLIRSPDGQIFFVILVIFGTARPIRALAGNSHPQITQSPQIHRLTLRTFRNS